MRRCKIISIIVNSFLLIICLNVSSRLAFASEILVKQQGTGVSNNKETKLISSSYKAPIRASQYLINQSSYSNPYFNNLSPEQIAHFHANLARSANEAVDWKKSYAESRNNANTRPATSTPSGLVHILEGSKPKSIGQIDTANSAPSQRPALKEKSKSVTGKIIFNSPSDLNLSSELVATHENAVVPYRNPTLDAISREPSINLQKATENQNKSEAFKISRVPKSITEEPIPADKKIQSMIDTKNSEQAVKDLFAQATNKLRLFSTTSPELNPQNFTIWNTQISDLISTYRLTYNDGLIDPIVKLKQDINTLNSIDISNFTSGGRANVIHAKQLGNDAVDAMIEEEVKKALSPLGSKVSVYQVVVTLGGKINDITIKKNSGSSMFKDVYKYYEDVYKAIQKPLLEIQQKVIELEGNRWSSTCIKDAQEKVKAALELEENSEKIIVLQRAQDQIELDSTIQEDAISKVALQVAKKFNDVSQEIIEDVNIATGNNVIKLVLEELRTMLALELPLDNDLMRKLEIKIGLFELESKKNNDFSINSFETNSTQLINDLQDLKKQIESKNKDLKTFIDKTENLQIYIEVIKKIVAKVKDLEIQGNKGNKVIKRVNQYIDTIFPDLLKKDKMTATNDIEVVSSTDIGNQIDTLTATMNGLNISNGLFAVSTDVSEFNEKIRDILPEKQTKLADLQALYEQVIDKLTSKKKYIEIDEYNHAVADQEVKILKKEFELPTVGDPLKSSIIKALTNFTESKTLSQATKKTIKSILKKFEDDIKDKVKFTKEDAKVVRDAIGKLSDTAQKTDAIKRSPQQKQIIINALIIDKLIAENETHETNRNKFNHKVESLKELVTVGQSFTFGLWAKDEINRSRIKDLEKKLNKAISLSLTNSKPLPLGSLIKDFNRNLSSDNKISENTTLEQYQYLLRELSQEELLKINDQSDLFRNLKWAGESLPSLPRWRSTEVDPQDQANVNAAQQEVRGATTEEAQSTALHNLVRVILNANYMAAAGVTFLGGSGATIALIIQFHAALNSQINNNNNLTDDEKKKLIDESNATMMMDIFNAIAAEKSGADMTAIQSGDAQSIAESMAFNKAIGLLDPTMQYNSSNSADALINSKAFADSYNAWLKQQAQNKSTGTGKSSTVIYPSYQDLLAMENAHNASTTNYGTTSPSYSYSPSTSSSSSQTKTSTTYNPYTSSPYASAAG